MSRNFEYFYTQTAMGELEIEDIGNCVIEAVNDTGCFYYLCVQTTLGWTKITEYGPATPDFFELPKSVTCTFNRIEYDERKISNTVNLFLNNSKRNITQARVVDLETMLTNTKSILKYIENIENF